MSKDSKNHPAFELFVVGGEQGKETWTKVAPVWPTKEGGFAGTINPGLAIGGRFVMRPYEPKAKGSDEPG